MLLIIIDHVCVRLEGLAQDSFVCLCVCVCAAPMVFLHHLFLPPSATSAGPALPLSGVPLLSPVID